MPLAGSENPKNTTRSAVDWRLNDATLIRNSSYINGEWLAPERDARFDVENPATGESIGFVWSASEGQIGAAIASSEASFEIWRNYLPQERAKYLMAWADEMVENAEDLAQLMTREQGKPLHEARGEIVYAQSFLRWFAEEAKRVRGESAVSHLSNRQTFISREPIGVTAAITPWNFPSAMITRKAGAALAAGCSMIVKPAPETPYSALALAVLAERAGIPAGVFNVLVGDAVTIGEALTRHPSVRALSFTGSSRVGKILLAQSAPTVKKVSLELGGHAPFIVFADADLDLAVSDAVTAKFQTTGQDCLAANRILVEAPIYEDFLERFTQAVRGLRLGAGDEEGVDLGPLIHSRATDRCIAQVNDAVLRGARLQLGGGRDDHGAAFMQPTVLADVDETMKIWSEETFGPVAALAPFLTEAEAVARANDSEYGLAAYVYTQNSARTLRVSNHLRYGMIAINTPQFTGPPVPFGGMKQSGLGREGSIYGTDEYTELKYRCISA